MMARTQILKDIRPNIFLDMRKVFGILFFILSHIVFAHVGIETKPNFGLEAEILVLDSIIVDQKDSVESEEKIYVTSGTTLINLDNTIDEKIVIVQSPDSKTKIQKIAKTVTPKKVLNKSLPTKTVAKNPEPPTEYYYPSNKTDLLYSTNESFIKAVVPSTDSHSKFFIKPITIAGDLIFKKLEQKSYLICYQGVAAEYQNFISGRAPPAHA